MKKVRIGLGVFVAAVLIGSFFFSTAHAQGVDETIWEGKWFKVNMNFKGYERNFAGPPDWSPANDRFTGFVNIGPWTDPDGGIVGDEYFDAQIWYYDEGAVPTLTGSVAGVPVIGGWVPIPVVFNRIHGTPLDIVIWSQTDQGSLTDGTAGQRLAFAARISGKMDRTGAFLQTATFKCLGGYFVEMNSDLLDSIYQGSGITMTGTLIPATFCNSPTNQQYPPCMIR
jgi:hypothetical protein